MSELVERLRRIDAYLCAHNPPKVRGACAEAADRIEALEAELREAHMQALSDTGQIFECDRELAAERALAAQLYEALSTAETCIDYAGKSTFEAIDAALAAYRAARTQGGDRA